MYGACDCLTEGEYVLHVLNNVRPASFEIRLYYYVYLPILEFTNDETHKHSAIPCSKAKLTKAYKHILPLKPFVLVGHSQ